jgi:hypothetical protein
MNRWLSSLLILLYCLQPAWLYAQDGKLQKVRDEVRKPDPPDTKGDNQKDSTSKDSSNNDSSTDDDGATLEAIGGAVLGVCWLTYEALYGLPAQWIGDDHDKNAYFNTYPYADGRRGYMGYAWDAEELPEGLRVWSGRVFVEESNDFDGLNRVNAQLLIETTCRLGFQASTSYLREHLDNGGHDEMVVGDANVTWRFAQTEKVQMRTGLGFRWLADSKDSNFGVNFLYGGDFYPVKPLVVSTFLDLGNLGSAFVIHGRATAGVLLSRWEFFTGYDWLRIGSVDLHGPVAGIRVWF